MRRVIAAGLVLATLALAAPQAQAGGLFGGLFRGRRAPAQRNFNLQIGGGRGISFSRQVVRAQPVVVQQPAFQVQRQVVVQQRQVFAAPAVQYAAPVQVQQFNAVGVGGY